MLQSKCEESLVFLFFVLGMIVPRAGAQADYPFLDSKLNDDARIADLLKRLPLAEKVELMDGRRY